MRTHNLPALLHSFVGVERLIDAMEKAQSASAGGFPPCNIERLDENAYAVTLAVAGFSEEDLAIELDERLLRVHGRKARTEPAEGGPVLLHRGLAMRDFSKEFQLAEHIEVVGASLANGLLRIDLVRKAPEKALPVRIAIARG